MYDIQLAGALPLEIAIIGFYDHLFSCVSSQLQTYFIYAQFPYPELVIIMDRRNVDKVCENGLLVSLESFILF